VKTQAKNKTELRSTRDAFGEVLVELGARNESIVVLSADLAESTRVHLFAEKYPERFVEVGVAEQNMASVAVGLALAGKIPVIASFASFSPGKNWDQIRLGVCYNNVNVKIVSTHAGINAGPDGATHQSLEDIALMRVLPNMTIFSPADYSETKKVVEKAFEIEGPVYIRLARPKTPLITPADVKFEVGKVKDIPIDYEGEMGVPITFLDKHNPSQFEIIGSSMTLGKNMKAFAEKGTYSQGGPRFYLDKGDGTYRRLYDRIVIKKRK